MARIIVCGYMIRHPVAGNILAFFHYVLGLYRLGHEVLYLEDSGWPQSCYNPVTGEYGDDPSVGLPIVQKLMATYDVKAPAVFVNRDSGKILGGTLDDVKSMLGAADLLLNIGGTCWLPEFHLCRKRAFIDMDPLFTQLGIFGGESLNDHHVHFSYGKNIGHNSCTVPTGGIYWHPTVPPVVPEIWQNPSSCRGYRETKEQADAPFTTIANWSAYGGVSDSGEHYGQKDEEFLRFLDLPSRTSQRLELTLSGSNKETKERLRSAGWSVRDGREVSAEVLNYQKYITDSRGEFSVAKHAYVKTRSGWFSDRSVCYLAAGLPVILQDTGFTDWLSTGRGVLAFSSVEEAVGHIERVNSEYATHRQAAREKAEQVFSYKVVLPRLLEAALDTQAPRYSAVLPEGTQ